MINIEYTGEVAAQLPKMRLHHLFPGLQVESMGAVALAQRHLSTERNPTEDSIVNEIKRILLRVLVPERAVQLRLDPVCQPSYVAEQALWDSYFEQPHNSLRQYLRACVGNNTRATILTHTPPTTSVDHIIRAVFPHFKKLDPLSLQREQDFRGAVIEFLESPSADLLIVQLYLKEVSARLLQHARHIVHHEAHTRNSTKPVLYLLHIRPRSEMQIAYDPVFSPVLIPDLEDDILLPDSELPPLQSLSASLIMQLPQLLSMCEVCSMPCECVVNF